MWGGGGGGEDENYVSVEDFIGGKGFQINLGNATVKITPTKSLGYYTNPSELTYIGATETNGQFQSPEGTGKGIVIPGGTLDISTLPGDEATFGEIRYYVFDGSPRHGILYIPSVSSDNLPKIATALHQDDIAVLSPSYNPKDDGGIKNMSILVDFIFNDPGKAAVYSRIGRLNDVSNVYLRYTCEFDFSTLK